MPFDRDQWKVLAKKIDADDRAELKREICKLHKLLTDCAQSLGSEWDKTVFPHTCDALDDALTFLRLAVEMPSARRIVVQEKQSN